jgi:ribosomal protein S18 acetylase RimI-like enzyme
MNATWESTEQLSTNDRLAVLDLLHRRDAQLGRESMDEERRRAVLHSTKAQHWLRRRGHDVIDYAQATNGERTIVERCGAGVDEDLLAKLLEINEVVDWWVRDNETSSPDTIRMLHLQSIDLPQPVEAIPPSATQDTFTVGVDEGEWLRQNNEAFANHPDQGAWRAEDLAERMNEPWFDPSGFILLRIDGVLAGSCWTKMHEFSQDRFGEIYVLSISPAFQGQGLGKVLLSQGLHTLWRRGVRQAHLFVDVTNDVANQLYTSVGFRTIRVDQMVRFTRA